MIVFDACLKFTEIQKLKKQQLCRKSRAEILYSIKKTNFLGCPDDYYRRVAYIENDVKLHI